MSLPQLPRTSLPDQVFRRLVGDVLSGRYAPGERLPAQRALAAELGVNMASVREGVKRLEQLRLVATRARRRDARARTGARRAGSTCWSTPWPTAAALDRALVREVFEARRLLLAEAAALAAGRRDRRSSGRCWPGSRPSSPRCATTRAAQGLDLAFMAHRDRGGGEHRVLAHRELDPRRLPRSGSTCSARSSPAARRCDYDAVAAAIAAGDADAARAAMAALAAEQEARLLEALA